VPDAALADAPPLTLLHVPGGSPQIGRPEPPAGPLRARTRARDGFAKAFRAAYPWLDKLLSDPTQTVESLAVPEGKSEPRSG
jgi:hypothetical protein